MVEEFYQRCSLELAVFEGKIDEETDPVELNLQLDRLEEQLAEIYDKVFLLTFKEWQKLTDAGLKISEYLKIREDLEKDYNVNQETLQFFDLINQQMRYQADYDGTLENNSVGINFTGREFKLPEFLEIMAVITPQQLRHYQRMVRDGMMPQLQVAPIGYSVATLVDKFSLKKDLFLDEKNKSVLRDIKQSEFVQEKDLLYGENIQTGAVTAVTKAGGKFKSQWIEENGGYQINIVATKTWVHPDIQKEWQEEEDHFSYSKLLKKSREKFRQVGFCGMTLETNLIALMNENRLGTHTTRDTRQLLLDVIKPGKDSAPCCTRTWMDIIMDGSILESGHPTMWVRPAIRIKLNSSKG